MRYLLFLLSLAGFSQLGAQDAATAVVRIPSDTRPEKMIIPFCAIKVLDARFNRDNIGSVVKDYSLKGRTENKMLAVFPQPFEIYLASALSGIVNLDSAAKDTLAILVKQFRIADHIPFDVDQGQVPRLYLSLSWSLFRNTDQVFWRIRSANKVLSGKWSPDFRITTEDLMVQRESALAKLLLELIGSGPWTASQTPFSHLDVEESITKRLEQPFLTDTVRRKGLYKTYQEFQQNSPSSADIRLVRTGGTGKVLAGTKYIDPENVWGVSDGKDQYIVFLGKWYLLHPAGNNFYIVYKRRLTELFSRDNNDIPVGRRMSIERNNRVNPLTFGDNFSPLSRPERIYLNLETGHFYTEGLTGTSSPENLRRRR
jgi:hypothetical protein